MGQRWPTWNISKYGVSGSSGFCWSSIVISLPMFSVILSALSHHFNFNLYGSLWTIILRVSGFSTLLRWPISFSVFLQLISKTEKRQIAELSSGFIVGPFVSLLTKAVADHISVLAEYVPRGTLILDPWIGSSLLTLGLRRWYIGPGSTVGRSR